jgi:hypothetical protein
MCGHDSEGSKDVRARRSKKVERPGAAAQLKARRSAGQQNDRNARSSSED